MSYVGPDILLYSLEALVTVAVAVAAVVVAAAVAAVVAAAAVAAAEAATLVGSLDAGNVSAARVAAAVEENAAAYVAAAAAVAVAVASGKSAAVAVDFSFRSFVVSSLTQGPWKHVIYECHARGSVWWSGDDLIEVGWQWERLCRTCYPV